MAEFQRHLFKDAPQDGVGQQKIGEIYVHYYLYRPCRHFVQCALSYPHPKHHVAMTCILWAATLGLTSKRSMQPIYWPER